jgi:hypothetical protein
MDAVLARAARKEIGEGDRVTLRDATTPVAERGADGRDDFCTGRTPAGA